MNFLIICPNCQSNNVEVFSTIDMEVIFVCQDCNYRETTDDDKG